MTKEQKVNLIRVLPGPHRKVFSDSMSAMGLKPLTTMEALPKNAEYWWTEEGWETYGNRALEMAKFSGFKPKIKRIKVHPDVIWETDGIQAILVPA